MSQPKDSSDRLQRPAVLQKIKATPIWDVLVIGGGASGLGVALESASRGYQTLLLEAHDYAKGTSSRSTKLVHGGVRYLAQGDISMVKEALHERGLLKRNAPHLVHDMGFLIAAYSWSAIPFYGVGMKIYDLLAGKLKLKSSRWVSKTQAQALMPNLQSKGLKGGVLYFDGQFDDSRLAITLVRTLFDYQGWALNHAAVTQLIKEEGLVVGAMFKDEVSGEIYQVRAKKVVNATGVFVDEIRQMEDPTLEPMLSPSQGVHLVVDENFCPANAP